MKTEEELLAIEQKQMKMARKTAAIFGFLAITALIAIVFAFFQQAAAEKARAEIMIELLECQRHAEETDARADLANKKLERMIIDATIVEETKKSKTEK